jgi:hypothetical protein
LGRAGARAYAGAHAGDGALIEGGHPRRAFDTRVRTVRGRMYVARGNEIFELEETAARIWQLLDGSRSVGEIADVIAGEYDVDRATAEADVTTFISELRDIGFVVDL